MKNLIFHNNIYFIKGHSDCLRVEADPVILKRHSFVCKGKNNKPFGFPLLAVTTERLNLQKIYRKRKVIPFSEILFGGLCVQF